MKNSNRVFIAGIAIAVVCINLFAQDQIQPRGPALERIEQFKKVRLIEVLKMDEETSVRFFSRYTKFTETLRSIQKDHNALIDQLQKMVKSDATDSEIEQTLKDIKMSEEKMAETRAKFIDELKDIISLKQIAEYVVFERNFNKNLREIMQDIAKGRWNRQR